MRGRLAPTRAKWLPRVSPASASPQARKRTSSAYSRQVQVCQMPRSFSRIAGRSPRTRAWCMSSFGNVSSVSMPSSIEPSSSRPADSCTESFRVRVMNGTEHWTRKGDVKLFLWRKQPAATTAGTILFVHGSSMACQPAFDLHVPGRPHSSVMEWFAERGFDTWTMDKERYAGSDKSRPINCDIPNGADDLEAGTAYIQKTTGAKKLLVYGISSGALRAALFAQRHPERVARLALDAFVWTGEGSPTLAERRKRL